MKRLISAFMLIIFIVSIIVCQLCAGAFDINSENAILVETKTNSIVFQKNINDKVSPGAVTKLMTAIIAYEYGALEDVVAVTSDMIAKAPPGQSYITIRKDEQLTVRQLLYCMILDSSNAAAYALAQHVGGSQEEFCRLMNDKAERIGAVNTNFVNSTGTDANNQYSTVWDLYIISEYFSRTPELMTIAGAQSYTIPKSEWRTNDTKFYTNNHLLSVYKTRGYYYRYADGLIGGYTEKSGNVISAAASRGTGSMNLIFIGLGSQKAENPKEYPAFSDALSVFNEAYSDYEKVNIIKKGALIDEGKLKLSFEKDYIPLVAAADVSTVLPKERNKDDFEYNIYINPKIKAPIKAGEILGQYNIYYKGTICASCELTTNADVSGNIFLIVSSAISTFFSNILVRIIVILLIAAAAAYIVITIRINKRRKEFTNNNKNRY